MTNGQKHIYEFGPFRVDSGERVLLRDGVVVPLPPKAFDTLVLLIRNSGRALDKDALMKELWPDTFVEEANLAQHISLLRKVLGESTTQRQYIETIPRRGYRFLAKVAETVDGRTETGLPTTQRVSRKPIIGTALLGIAIFASGFAVSWVLPRTNSTEISSYRFTPLVVDSSLKTFPAWSPSGKTVAYCGEVAGVLQIFTKSLGTAAPAQITRQATDCVLPFWSPDGQRIFYQAVAGAGPSVGSLAFDLWSVGAAGGTPELMMKRVWHAALSPDGKTLAMIRSDRPGGVAELWFSSPPGAEPKRYTRAPFAAGRYHSYAHLQFSPDGSKLGVSVASMHAQPEFWILPLPTGEPRRALTSLPRTAGPRKFSWTPDSRNIVFAEHFHSTSNPHLFTGDTERNIIRPITVGVAAEQFPSVSPANDAIAYASMEAGYDIVEIPFDGSGIRNLLSSSRNEVTPAWSP